jgi:chorismate synthase
MSGNSFGEIFRITTFGESHGVALGVVIDGCPPRLVLKEEDIQKELDKRRPGKELTTTRQEPDKVEIISGVFDGQTTGTPIALIVYNKDVDSTKYKGIKDVFRPGHGDFTYFKKYGVYDWRGGGRASGRETVARVAAGAVAQKILDSVDIKVYTYTVALGGIYAKQRDLGFIEKNPLFCCDKLVSKEMEKRILEVKKQGDSLGGIVEVRVKNCPIGLGEPVFDKLDADLAKGLMSIGAVKGVEIGAGFKVVDMLGSVSNDEITPRGFLTNNAGGILAGISNGDDIIVRAAIKPIASIVKKQRTIKKDGQQTVISVKGRHDISAIPRIVPVCAAMVRVVLADHLLRKKAIG